MKHRRLLLGMALLLSASAGVTVPRARAQALDAPLFLEIRADGVPIVVKVVDGEMGLIWSAVAKVGLIPKVKGDQVELHAFEIFSEGGFGEKARETDIVTVAVGNAVRLDNARVDLEVRPVRSAVAPVPSEWTTGKAGSGQGGALAGTRTPDRAGIVRAVAAPGGRQLWPVLIPALALHINALGSASAGATRMPPGGRSLARCRAQIAPQAVCGDHRESPRPSSVSNGPGGQVASRAAVTAEGSGRA